MKTLSASLEAIIIEPVAAIGKTLARDLRRLNITQDDTPVVTQFSQALSLLRTRQPHLVFISLDMPNDAAFRLLEEFPFEKRSFTVVLLAPPELDKYLRSSLLHNAEYAGYLVKGQFGNGELVRVLEEVRRHLQSILFHEYKSDVFQAARQLTNTRSLSAKKSSVPKAMKQKTIQADTPVNSEQNTFSHQNTSFTISIKQNGDTIQKTIAWTQVIYMEFDKNYLDVWYMQQESDAIPPQAQHVLIRRDSVTIPDIFVKPHRSFLVNALYINDVEPDAIKVSPMEKRIALSHTNKLRLQEVLEWNSKPFVIVNECIRILKADIKKANSTRKTTNNHNVHTQRTVSGGGNKKIGTTPIKSRGVQGNSYEVRQIHAQGMAS